MWEYNLNLIGQEWNEWFKLVTMENNSTLYGDVYVDANNSNFKQIYTN